MHHPPISSPVETTEESTPDSDEIEPNVDAIANTDDTGDTDDSKTTDDTSKTSEESNIPDTETSKQDDEAKPATETPPEESIPENIKTKTPSDEAFSDKASEDTETETDTVPEKSQEKPPADHAEPQPDEYNASDISDEELLNFAKQTIAMVNGMPNNGLLVFQSIMKEHPGSKQEYRNTLLNLLKNDMYMPLTNENAWEHFKKLHQKGKTANE